MGIQYDECRLALQFIQVILCRELLLNTGAPTSLPDGFAAARPPRSIRFLPLTVSHAAARGGA
jgi:hypothetical protein